MEHAQGELFELVGGPDDGRVVPVDQCVHGNWPDLFHPDEEFNSSCYRYDDATDRYVWVLR